MEGGEDMPHFSFIGRRHMDFCCRSEGGGGGQRGRKYKGEDGRGETLIMKNLDGIKLGVGLVLTFVIIGGGLGRARHTFCFIFMCVISCDNVISNHFIF